MDQLFEELKHELHESANLARLLDAFYEKSNLVENETSVFHTFFCLLAKTETVANNTTTSTTRSLWGGGQDGWLLETIWVVKLQ